MSILTLVRHGQASFFADDYDVLSPTGELQARQLGAYLARQEPACTEVYVGPRRRQQQTAEFAGAEYRRHGRDWPASEVAEELDEYDLAGLLQRLAPALADQDPAFADLASGLRQSVDDLGKARAFQRMFEALTMHWLTTAVTMDAVEAWSAFRERVQRGLRRITEGPRRGRHVVAFTSGGFIGTATALVLGAPDRTALELNWRMKNCSLTRLLFAPGRMTLDEFNAMPHLPGPASWTYR